VHLEAAGALVQGSEQHLVEDHLAQLRLDLRRRQLDELGDVRDLLIFFGWWFDFLGCCCFLVVLRACL
jgi:hypothetical protein